MYSARTIGTRFATTAVLLFAIVSIASAQNPYFYRWDNGAGNNVWGVGTNWGLNPPLNSGVNNFTPNAYYEEMGLINNGNVVNVTTSQTQFSGSAANSVTAAAGVTIDGIAAPGNGSRLNIASGGTLSLLVTYGSEVTPPGPAGTLPTANTGNAVLNNFGQITVQPGGTLNAKSDVIINSGSVTVGGAGAGGTLTAGSIIEAGVNSTLNLTGSATVSLANGAVLTGTTTITGPNVVFNTPGIGMNGNTVFSPIITSNAVAAGTGHSVINVSGGVVANGTLRPQFQGAGVAPHLGDTWTLWDSAQTLGNFTVSDVSGTGAALPTGVRYALTTTKVGSINGVKGQLTVENFLTAEVNRANGQVNIRNTNTTVGPGVTITGYQVGSPAGALRTSSFASPFGGAWQSANLTANSIGELNPASNSAVGLGANVSLGNVYDPVALQTTFGTTPVSDLTFSYTRSDGRTVNAPVTYINTGLANTFVLQVDPSDGKARIVNDSVFNSIQFDGYQITSTSGSLLTAWNSFQDQTIAGWEEASPTINSLAELNTGSTKTVNAGQTAATMTGLFKTVGGMQDLAFQFRVPGTGPGTGVLNGVVRYAAFNSNILIGDYNGNQVVDAADYTVWRNLQGQAGNLLPNRDPANGSGPISPADYASWKINFGAVLGAGSGAGVTSSAQVPEPATFVLASLFTCGLLLLSRRSWCAFRCPSLCLVPISNF